MRNFCIWLFACLWLPLAAMGQTFTLKSKDIGGQGTYEQSYQGFGCTGKNTSPQLYWENPPAGTKSFAITMYDPDAPTGSGWWHWVVFNIPADVREFKTGAGNVKSGLAPKGCVQSLTDYGIHGYGGPCPDPGHYDQYIITVYALKVDKLDLDQSAMPALVGFELLANSLERASIIMYSKRW